MGSFVATLATLILALAGLTAGLQLARRRGILSLTFWQTFRQYPGYRLKHSLAPAALLLSGSFFLGAGGINLYLWLRAFYLARLGHPLP